MPRIARQHLTFPVETQGVQGEPLRKKRNRIRPAVLETRRAEKDGYDNL